LHGSPKRQVGPLGSLFSSDFFGFIDTGLAGPILAPLSALLVVLFTGWRLDKAILAEELAGPGQKLGEFIFVFIRYIAPVFMGFVLIAGVWETYKDVTLVIDHGLLLILAGAIVYYLKEIAGSLAVEKAIGRSEREN